MKIKVSWIVPKNSNAICLWPFGIYVSDPKFIDDDITHYDRVLLNHEKIHWAQAKETLGFMYIWYGVEWFIKLITPPIGAYRDISLEREAYVNQNNLNYLEIRKRYSWLKYILQSSN